MEIAARVMRIKRRIATDGVLHLFALARVVLKRKVKYCKLKFKYHFTIGTSDFVSKSSGLERTFFFTAEDLAAYKTVYKDNFADEVDRTIQLAEKICSHDFRWLSPNCPVFETSIKWQTSFQGKREWPPIFFLDLNFFGDDITDDVREVWELNRHQHFVILGKAYWLSGNNKYRNEFKAQLKDWVDQNRTGFGMNWHNAQEAAVRGVSWLWAAAFFTCQERFDSVFDDLFKKALYRHAEFIALNLSDHPLTHNHLITEVCGLATIALVHPEFKHSDKWLMVCLSIMQREVRKQIWDDGISGEMATNYHCFVLDSLLSLLALLQKNGISVPDDVASRIEAMTAALVYFLRPDGSLPLIGDSDGGRAFRLSSDAISDRRHYLSTGAVLFKRGDLKHVSGRFHEESFWLTGPEGLQGYKELDEHPPTSKGMLFRPTGFAAYRNDWSVESDHLLVRGGPSEFRQGVRVGHNHADLLSFELYIKGQRLFVDPGLYQYGCDISWRRYYRKTLAHNTVVVDGRDQFDVSSKRFGVYEMPLSRVTLFEVNDDSFILEMSHGGYDQQGITHKRTFYLLKNHYLILHDHLDGDDEHDIVRHFHFHSDVVVKVNAERILLSPGGGDSVFSMYTLGMQGQSCDIRLAKGSTEPIEGWTSDRYGERTSSPVLKMATRANLPASMTTVIFFNNIDLNREELVHLVRNCKHLPPKEIAAYE